MANFANLIFFRCRDPLVDELAAAYLGESKEKLLDVSRSERSNSSGRKRPTIVIEREIFRPDVRRGALARLPTGEAYALTGNVVYSKPLCLVPVYSKSQRKENDYGR